MKKLTAALSVAMLLTGCAGQAAESAPPVAPVGRIASANPGSVNTFWLRAPQGLIVVDAQRSLTDARRALAALENTGQPVAAILITHGHPDHVGGIGVLHEAYPAAPIYSSKATAAWMRADPLHFYELTRKLPRSDYAPELTYPDHTFAPGATLDVGGLRLQTAQFGPGETETATAYYEPKSGALFAGDVVADKATPALLEGHSCGWLADLHRLRTLFPDARTIYPGHGSPGNASDLMESQRAYLKYFRGLIQAAIGEDSPAGEKVSPDEQKSITTQLNRAYPGYPSVASLPTLVQENIKSVARELLAEHPSACQDA